MPPDEPRPGVPGPDHPLQALALDLADQAQRRVLSLTFAALGHLLAQQPWARERLVPHAGSVVLIGVSLPTASALPSPELRARIDAHGMLDAADPSEPADASVWLEPSSEALLAALQEGARGLQRHLRVEGDVHLAATLAELAQHLRWEAEEDLSRLIGDIAAHRTTSLVGRTASGLREFAQHARTALERFAAGGSQVINRSQWGDLAQQASALDQRLRAAESRVRDAAQRPSGSRG